MVVFLVRIVAVDDKAVSIYPICSLIQNNPFACQAVFAEVVASTALFIYKSTSDQHAVVVKHELLTVHGGRTSNCGIVLGREVVQICAVKSRTPASIEIAVDCIIKLAVCRNDSGRHIAAPCTGHRALRQIAVIAVLSFGAILKLLCIGVDQFTVHILGINSDTVCCGFDSQIHCTVAVVDAVKVIRGINGDIVALLAGRAANEVHYTIFIYDAILHGLGTGIGVVVSGEHKVNACRLHRLGQIVVHESVECLGICSVCRYMHGEYLPVAGGRPSILHKLLKSLLILTGA